MEISGRFCQIHFEERKGIKEMNEYALLHSPDSKFCFATGERELVIRLRVAKEDRGISVMLIFGNKYEYHEKRMECTMKIAYSDQLYDYYETKLLLSDVRLAYIFLLQDGKQSYYYSEDGLTTTYNFNEGFYNFFQMPYINRNDVHQTVEWMRDAVFYQIFVDRFYRGNYDKDDSYIDMEWGGKPTPKNFAGGDLRGIIEKLEYLKDLGITAIYMTPIFQSKSNHKYDISDYRKVDSQFGSLEDLRELVQKAHALGMRVVLDAVFNHCSEQLPEFADVMEKGKESPYYDWFLIDGDYPLPQEGNYECFASCAYMPKFNTASVAVQDYLIDIATYWIREADIDGWRLDVSDEVSHEFWRRFRQAVKQEKQDCVIIGENWHDAYPYLMGDQYDSIMNYAFTKACLDYFAKGKFSGEDMANQLNHILMRNTEPVNRMMLNLLDSHDTHRFFTEVGCNKDKLLAAVALNVMFPGATCIYYGTEICMEGGYDPDSRRCFDWDKSKWDMDAWKSMRELLHFKQTNTLGYGTVFLKGDGSCLYVERKDETACYRLWIHLGTEVVEIPDQNEVLLSHGYRNGTLAVGYVITREEYL